MLQRLPRPSLLSRACLAATALGLLVAAGPSGAQPADHEIVLALGEEARIDGAAVAGVNAGHLGGTDGTYPCGSDPAATCRSILVTVTNPYGDDVTKGRERANLSLALDGQGLGDAAIMVYESDADGERGALVASSDELGTLADEATDVTVTTTEDQETRHFLVEVFFHAWAGTWGLDAAFA